MFEDGHSYSELKQTCLDLTTLNIKLNPLKKGAITKGDAAYVVFDDANIFAEVFLPLQNIGLILTKTAEGNWSNGAYLLIAWKGYVIQKEGNAIYGG